MNIIYIIVIILITLVIITGTGLGIYFALQKSDKCTIGSCPSGKRCNTTTGKCEPIQPDKCKNVLCQPGDRCNTTTGKCEPIQPDKCKNVLCQPGDRCNTTTGKCEPIQPDKCKNVLCQPGNRCNTTTGKCEPIQPDKCKNVLCQPGERCNTTTGKCEPSGLKPNQQDIDLASKKLREWSSKYNDEPFFFFINMTDEPIVAGFGPDYGTIPCNRGDTECTWGNNAGKSSVQSIETDISNISLDNGIQAKWQILKPKEYWIVKMPINSNGKPDFCYKLYTNADDSPSITCDSGSNLFLGTGLTGKYYINTKGRVYNDYPTALSEANNQKHLITPETLSLSTTPGANLSYAKTILLEMGLHGSSNQMDLSAVQAVGKPNLYVGMYDSKTGDPLNCKRTGTISNNLGCGYNTKGCRFPVAKKDSSGKYKVVTDAKGDPYNCLQPGFACSAYKNDKDIAEVWSNVTDNTFSYTDSYGTTWDLDGCVPGTKYCERRDDGNLYYIGKKLDGNSCAWMSGGNVDLDGESWSTGSVVPLASKSDPIWMGANCGNNWGSESARLRLCEFDTKNLKSCPIRGGGSCLTENGKGTKDSWASPIMQEFCESCHSDTCGVYCMAYDDFIGTMSCPVNSETPSSVLIMGY